MKLYKVGITSQINNRLIDITYTTKPETIDFNSDYHKELDEFEVDIDESLITKDNEITLLVSYLRETQGSGIYDSRVIPINFDLDKIGRQLKLNHMYSKEYIVNKQAQLIAFDDMIYLVRRVKIDRYV